MEGTLFQMEPKPLQFQYASHITDPQVERTWGDARNVEGEPSQNLNQWKKI